MNAGLTPLLPTALRAVVFLTAAGATALAAEPAQTPRPKEGPVVVLDSYQVLAEPPKLCFGLALEVWKDNTTGKVLSLYVTKVRPGSSAAETGIAPRTRIDRIDGRPVEQLTASFLKDGDLNRLFVNRKLGARIALEILPEGHSKPRVVVLTEKPWVELEVRIHDVDRISSFDQLRSVMPRARQ